MSTPGTLTLCPTPIGNLDDVTLRVLEELGGGVLLAAKRDRLAGLGSQAPMALAAAASAAAKTEATAALVQARAARARAR